MATSRAISGREVLQCSNIAAEQCRGRGLEGYNLCRPSGLGNRTAPRPTNLASLQRSISSLSLQKHELITLTKLQGPLLKGTAKRLPKFTVFAKWGRKQEPPAGSASAPPVEAPPPDARNLGRLSKVLPFSVYELQALNFPRDLKEGDYGADVEVLQRALHTFGHMPKDSQITGYFGKATFVAVREWQRSQGLPGTGYWGAMSRENFADVVQRHAEAQEALVTRASPTKFLTSTVSAAVPFRLPNSSAAKAGIMLGVLLVCAGAVAVTLRLRAGLREVKQSDEKEVRLSYQGRWGRPEAGASTSEQVSDDAGVSEGLLNKVGRALYEHFGRFEKAWNGRWREDSSTVGENERLDWEAGEGESAREYTGVLRYIRNDESISDADEISRLHDSIEALIKELSSVEVQRQAAVKALEEERERNQQLEIQLEYKVQAIAALKSELNSLKPSERSHVTASHRD